jgi:hypothetical protein
MAGIIVAMGMPMPIPPGIIGIDDMVDIDIGICMAGFMVTSWLDNEP